MLLDIGALCGDPSGRVVLHERLHRGPRFFQASVETRLAASRSLSPFISLFLSLSLSLIVVIVSATCRSAEGNRSSSSRCALFVPFSAPLTDSARRSRAVRLLQQFRGRVFWYTAVSVPERANASLSVPASVSSFLSPFLFPPFVSLSPSLVTCRLRNITRATYFRYTPRRAAVFSSRPHCLRPGIAARSR